MTPFRWLAILLCPLAMGACASMVMGNTETVTVVTSPKSGAACTLHNEKGRWEIASTPGSVKIFRSEVPLSVSCKHPDGDQGTRSVAASSSGTETASFIAGDAVGGLIGATVSTGMDRASGAAFAYPETIDVVLASDATEHPAATAAAAPPSAPAAAATTTETIPVADMLGDARALPGPVRHAARFCRKSYQDARLDPLRGTIALDAPPTLAMQSNAGFLTASQKAALDAYQPLHDSCRDRLMTADAEIARALDGHGVGNREFLSLYQGKSSIGDFNRAQAEEFERLKGALLKIAVAPPQPSAPPAAATVPTVYQPAPQIVRPIDYCQGLIEASCMEHLHRAPAAAQ